MIEIELKSGYRKQYSQVIISWHLYQFQDIAHATTRRSTTNIVHELAWDDNKTDAALFTAERESNIGVNILLLIIRQYFSLMHKLLLLFNTLEMIKINLFLIPYYSI